MRASLDGTGLATARARDRRGRGGAGAAQRRNEPRVTLFGADPAAMSGFGEIRAVSGGTVTLSALGPGEGT